MRQLKGFFLFSTTTEGKAIKIVNFIFRLITVLLLIYVLFVQHWSTAGILILALILYAIPGLIELKFKIDVPDTLEIIISSFIFSSFILGELGEFYTHIYWWDTALHTLNGFLAAAVGFSLVFLMNHNAKSLRLAPIFVALLTFSFSMTIGILWEFGEFSADNFLRTDMQKDAIVQRVESFRLSPSNNELMHITNIYETDIHSYDKSGRKITTIIKGGYLDVGIRDTMKDLFVNLIGAVIFSIFGFFYEKNQGKKFKFIENFLPYRVK